MITLPDGIRTQVDGCTFPQAILIIVTIFVIYIRNQSQTQILE